MFTLNQLDVFITVVASGSFSAAARKLNRAQSAISSTVANLEIELGVALFDRTTKMPTLTPEGRTLFQAAESILRYTCYMDELASTLSQGIEDQVDILFDDALPFHILEETSQAVSQQFPYLRLNILRPACQSGVELVLQGKATLGIVLTEANYDVNLSFRRLGDMVLVNTVPSTHPLSNLKVSTFATLHQYRRLVYTPHHNRLSTDEYLHSSNAWYLNSYALILKLMKQGMGWATYPQHLIRNELHAGELIDIDIEPYPVTEWLVGVDMIWSNHTRLGLAASWIRDFIVHLPQPELENTRRRAVCS